MFRHRLSRLVYSLAHGISTEVFGRAYLEVSRLGRAILRTKPAGITHQTPKRKEEVENKSIFRFPAFGLPELISSPPSTCPTTTLVDPTRPLSRASHPPAAYGRHHLLYNESLELTAPQHTAVKT
jgi:hypothetical protein